MASHDSAIKANKQAQKRRLRNRVHRTRLRTQTKKIRQALAAGDAEAAKDLLLPTISLLDRSVKHGVLHANSAARSKSRLTRAVRRIAAAG